MTLQEIVEQVRALPVEERKQLVMLILDSLTEPQPVKKGSILDYRGVGDRPKEGYTDADAYVRELRKEWDHRP